MSVCSHYMCKCVCKDREKSLSFLCLLGSGLPSCAHRCVCVFLRSYVWMHTVPPGTRDPPTPFSICSAVSQGGWPWAALAHSLPSLWMEGPENGPFKGLSVRVPGCHCLFSEPVFPGSLPRAPGSQLGYVGSVLKEVETLPFVHDSEWRL